MKLTNAPLLILAAVLLSSSASAQCPLEGITTLDGHPNNFFGTQVAATDDYLIVGATHNSEAAHNGGAVYIFERVGGEFVEVEKVFSTVPENGHYFGMAVAIDGERALVGSSNDNQMAFSAGAGFLYQRTSQGWVLEDTLFAADPQHAESLGFSTAIEGTRAVLGAPGTNLQVGKAIVFEKTASGWMEVAQLLPNGPEDVHFFGHTVEVCGDRIAVGASSSDGEGAVYVYDLDQNGWRQVQRLVGSDAGGVFGYGHAIALEGDRVVYSIPAVGNGAAYVFEFDGNVWTETKRLTGSGDPLYNFGAALDIRGDRIAVGGIDMSFWLTAQEYVEVFQLRGDDWVTETRLTPAPSSIGTSAFGEDLALHGDAIVIGSPADWDPLENSGSLHLYNLERRVEAFCDATINSTGSAAQLSVDCGDELNRIALNAGPLPNTVGLFFYGTREVHAPAMNGVRCVGGSMGRMPVVATRGGQMSFEFNLGDPDYPLIQAGSTCSFQAWYRDSGIGAGANFSSAAKVTLAP